MALEVLPVVGAAVTRPVTWAKVIDHAKCIGCHACTTACKAEHLVPLGVTRTYVKQVEVGVFPAVRRQFQVTRCNHCESPPCVPICPVSAMYRRPDGIVDFDTAACIGCKACMAACPYDAIHINPESNAAEKCNFCAHRIDQGLEPACVVVCPAEAIVVGDLHDPTGPIGRYLGREKLSVRKPEKATRPKVMYHNAGYHTLSPTAAGYAGMHLWSEQHEGYPVPVWGAALPVGAAPPVGVAPPGAPLVAYDVPHKAPWGWRVSAYTWSKSVAAGLFALVAILRLAGLDFGAGWFAAAAFTSGLFLALTGALLATDLTMPARFIRVLTRPQWRSWLARGAFIITGYGAVLAASCLAGLLAAGPGLLATLAVLAIPTGLMSAVYTAFLFAQARGRDLWQNPLLPMHLGVQAFQAGAAALLLMGLLLPLPATALLVLRWTLLVTSLTHGLFGLSDYLIPHVSGDAALAVRHLTRGRMRDHYWGGLLCGALAPAAIAAATGNVAALAVAAVAALGGLLAYEHAYVQAGQSVPLA